MIEVDDLNGSKVLTFSRSGLKTVSLRRDAVFAHRCPKCRLIVHGLFIHQAEDVLPQHYRDSAGAEHEILFKAFAEPPKGFIVTPEFHAPAIRLHGVRGQYFYDKCHFIQHGLGYHGRCKYTKAVFQSDDNVCLEAVRLAGALKRWYGTDDPKWKEFRERLMIREVAESVVRRIRDFAGYAPDVIGNGRGTVLLSKEDWDYGMFNTMVSEVIAGAEQDIPALASEEQ